MNILVTGAKGFIGKNLISELKNLPDIIIYQYDIDADLSLLEQYTKDCELVYHLAGVNRPNNIDDFMQGNYGFTSLLLDNLIKNKNKAPIVVTSSIQAEQDNPYGRSKKAGEDLLNKYSEEYNTKVFIYRLPNVFGKWCRPNYNSVIATFCHNIANDLDIQVNDSSTLLNLVYIDDVIEEFIKYLTKKNSNHIYNNIKTTHTVTLGRIVELLYSYKESRNNLYMPDSSDDFSKKLYSTYLSYLPTDKFSYLLKMNTDNRGSFTEFLKSKDKGQISINISRPKIVKGNHWHHTKNEKFLVVSGRGIIRFRKIDTEEIIEYSVSDEQLEVIDIPCGYTHNIENIGETDMVTIMWANELFNPDKADTYYELIQT